MRGFVESHHSSATPCSFESVFAWGVEGGEPPCDLMASSSVGAPDMPMEMASLSYPSAKCSVSLYEAHGRVIKGWVLINQLDAPSHVTAHLIACKFQDTLLSTMKL